MIGGLKQPTMGFGNNAKW